MDTCSLCTIECALVCIDAPHIAILPCGSLSLLLPSMKKVARPSYYSLRCAFLFVEQWSTFSYTTRLDFQLYCAIREVTLLFSVIFLMACINLSRCMLHHHVFASTKKFVLRLFFWPMPTFVPMCTGEVESFLASPSCSLSLSFNRVCDIPLHAIETTGPCSIALYCTEPQTHCPIMVAASLDLVSASSLLG